MPSVEDRIEFGPLLKRHRLAAGLTQHELADRAGLGIRTIQVLERGANTPQRATVERLLRALAAPDALRVAWEATLLRRRGPTEILGNGHRTPRNPYKGLQAFTAADADDFFGRDRLIATLLARVANQTVSGPRLIAVLGPSGSGKSSLVMAGLLPRLRGGALPASASWCYLPLLTPGGQPLEALALALATALPDRSFMSIREDLGYSRRGLHLLSGQIALGGPPRVVLLVDQFEELFTLTDDESERRQFIDLLVTAASELNGAVLVLITLRADFYDRPMQYPALGALLDAQGMAVLPLSTEEVRAAIEQPAALPDVRLTFESGLVDALVAELHGHTGALPLLQFTLNALVSRRESNVLTCAMYRDLGGVRGALAGQAEATYAGLPDEEHRQLARTLFLRLIAPGSSELDTTRRRVTMLELVLPDRRQTAVLRAVIDRFVGDRLVVATCTYGPNKPGLALATLEVSHEALFREWGRLGEWLREARDDIRLMQRLSSAAVEWLRRDRPADQLYRGLVLDEAIAWAGHNSPSATELEFLKEGLAARQRQEANEHERQARELDLARRAVTANRRAADRLRYLAASLIVFLMLAAGLAVVAIEKSVRADANAANAKAAEAAAQQARDLATSRQLAAQALNHLGDQYDLSLLLGVEAVRVADTGEARNSLLRAVLANPRLLTILSGHTDSVTDVAFSRDGRVVASTGADGTVRLWDVSNWRQRLVLRAGQPVSAPVNRIAFSPDSAVLASGSDDGTIQLWRVASGRPLGVPFPDQTDSIKDIAFSPNGKTLVTVSGDGAIRFWSVAGRQLLGDPLVYQNSVITAVAFSPDGRTLASGTQDGAVLWWDVTGRRRIGQPLHGHAGAVTAMAFSPNGKILASASQDQTIRLWRVATRMQATALLRGHTGTVTGVAFSPDGRTLASSSADHTIRLWDVADARPSGPPLLSHSDAVEAVAFSPDGTMLASGSLDTSIRLWSMAAARPLNWVLRGHTAVVSSVAFSPNGNVLTSGSQDRTARLWDVTTHQLLGGPMPPQPMGVNSVRFNPADSLLATGDDNGAVQLWDMTHPGGTWRPVGSPMMNPHNVESIAFSPNGAVLAAGLGYFGNAILLWNVRSRQPIGHLLAGHTDVVTAVTFSGDSRLLATASQDHTLRLWSMPDGRPFGAPLLGHTDSVDAVAFSPNGVLLASGGADTTVRLWTVASGRPFGAPLRGHVGAVTGVAFSPDGRLLASASNDGTIRLWDVATGQQIGPPLTGHRGAVTSIAFSPNGRLLASGGADTTVRLWDVGLGSWEQRACAVANRALTPQEWQQYLGGLPYTQVCP